MDVSLWSIFLAAVLQFVIGAVWYSVLFGKQWAAIHGFDKLTKNTQEAMAKRMAPFYALQFVLSFVTAYVLAHFIVANQDIVAFKLAAWLWFGFMLPVQISAVVFGGTEPKWMVRKIAIMAGGSLACMLAAAAVIQFVI